MKVGNLVNCLAVVDVKRITSLNLTAFTRDIVKYLDEGYRIDVSSTREVGLQKRVDMFKVEDNKKDVEVIPFSVYFEEYYNQSIEKIEKFKEIYNNGDKLIKGNRAYLDKYFECCFIFSFDGGFIGVNMLHGGEFYNKFGYTIYGQGLNIDSHNYLKSEEQLKYKSLDELWEEIFI